jgi:hypothetical protein
VRAVERSRVCFEISRGYSYIYFIKQQMKRVSTCTVSVPWYIQNFKCETAISFVSQRMMNEQNLEKLILHFVQHT